MKLFQIVQNVHMEKIIRNLCENVTKIVHANVRLRQFYNFLTFSENVNITNNGLQIFPYNVIELRINPVFMCIKLLILTLFLIFRSEKNLHIWSDKKMESFGKNEALFCSLLPPGTAAYYYVAT